MKINEIISSIDKDKILELFIEYFEYDGEITIDDNRFISCSGNVKLIKKIYKLPVKFLKVDGNFDCRNNNLETLEGSPTSVSSSFSCSNNQLTTLVGGPTSVDGDFYCHNNQLTTLDGSPTSVSVDFNCSYNQLTTLEGSPTSVGGDFSCSRNQLTTLEGGPTSVGGGFYCYNNPNLKNLNHLPIGISEVSITYLPTMPLLKCLIANNIQFHPNTNIINIIEDVLNKYAGQGRRGALSCAADLLSLGKKLNIDLTMNARW